jgi:hypothetical protein
VPWEYQHYDLAGICQRLRIEVAGKHPELRAR